MPRFTSAALLFVALTSCVAVGSTIALVHAHRKLVRLDPCHHGAVCDQPRVADDSATAIERVLTQQAADWNRGDLDAFAAGYKRSPDILFIGRHVSRGYDQMVASYKKGYATRDAMGVLSFSNLEVQPLDAEFATATGHYHLERTATGGGNADGYFLLVLENTADGWRIVRDDTTALPAAAK